MLRPEAPAFGAAEAERWHRAGWRRAAFVPLLCLTSLVVLVVAVVAGETESAVYAAVTPGPVLVLARPVLGALTGFGAGVFLAVSPEPDLVRVVFGVHAVLCLAFLVGFWWQARAQRKIVAEVALPVSVDLSGDLVITAQTRFRLVWSVVLTAIGVAVGFFAAEWWWLTGIFTVVISVREVAVRVLPPRLMNGSAVAMLVRAEPGRGAVLVTEALNAVATVPAIEVVHPRGSDDPLLTLTRDEGEERTPLVPATVVGDFRAGGWVVVVTENCVLLPSGPVRDAYEEPLTVPSSLVDGRRWSGLQA